MADQTSGSIEIDADAKAVMAQIADYEAYPDWSSEIRSAEILERYPDGRGKHVHFAVSNGPLKADYTLEYVYEGDTRLTWTFVEGTNIRNLEGSYTLEDGGDGETLVTYAVRIDTPIPMLGFMKRQIEKRIIDVALKGLKKRVESR